MLHDISLVMRGLRIMGFICILLGLILGIVGLEFAAWCMYIV